MKGGWWFKNPSCVGNLKTKICWYITQNFKCTISIFHDHRQAPDKILLCELSQSLGRFFLGYCYFWLGIVHGEKHLTLKFYCTRYYTLRTTKWYNKQYTSNFEKAIFYIICSTCSTSFWMPCGPSHMKEEKNRQTWCWCIVIFNVLWASVHGMN